MALAFSANIGTANSKTANQASTSLTTTAAASAGDVITVLVGSDNDGGGGGNEHTGMTDSAGNTYSKGVEKGSTLTAQNGVTISWWYCKLVSALASGGTITVSFSNATTRDASAMTAHKYTMDTSKVLILQGSNSDETVGGGVVASLTATTANVSCLRVRGVGAETASVLLGTGSATPGWTELTDAASTGGGGASNVSIMSENVISTSTSDASDPSWTTGSNDTVSIYVAISEGDPPSQTSRPFRKHAGPLRAAKQRF